MTCLLEQASELLGFTSFFELSSTMVEVHQALEDFDEVLRLAHLLGDGSSTGVGSATFGRHGAPDGLLSAAAGE